MGWFFFSRTSARGYLHQQQFKKELKSKGVSDRRTAEMFDSSDSIRKKVRAAIETDGSVRERRALERVLRDLDRFAQARKPRSKELAEMNLMESVVQFWALGKMEQRWETRSVWQKVLETKLRGHDSRTEDLFYLAYSLELQSSQERDEKAKWNQTHRKDGAFLHPEAETTESLNYPAALRLANSQAKLFSEEEFDQREIDLQAHFKTWRSRNRTKR
jgi:hypothetical protein